MPFWPILRPILGAVRAGGLSGSGLARCGHSVGILRLLGHQCRQGCRNRRHRTSLWTDGRISRSGLFIRASRVAEVNNPLADARHGGHCKTAKGGNPYAPLCKPAFGLGWRADTAWIRCGRSAGFWFGCCGLSRGRWWSCRGWWFRGLIPSSATPARRLWFPAAIAGHETFRPGGLSDY